jgi:hypothetical protein
VDDDQRLDPALISLLRIRWQSANSDIPACRPSQHGSAKKGNTHEPHLCGRHGPGPVPLRDGCIGAAHYL